MTSFLRMAAIGSAGSLKKAQESRDQPPSRDDDDEDIRRNCTTTAAATATVGRARVCVCVCTRAERVYGCRSDGGASTMTQTHGPETGRRTRRYSPRRSREIFQSIFGFFGSDFFFAFACSLRQGNFHTTGHFPEHQPRKKKEMKKLTIRT